MIPYGKQEVLDEDIDAVVEVLKSDYLTQGHAVLDFESALCKYTGAEYSVTTNSCTSALHIACLALGLGKNDVVWTSPITFVASANCARYCGADVEFVDVDPDTGLMSVICLRAKLELAEEQGKLPKIVIPVHLAGQPCDMKDIHALGIKYGFKIIEDAAHAIGAEYANNIVGNCRYSDITVFSFHPVKVITTGEGGAAMTNNKELQARMLLLRSHGITRDARKMLKSDGPWYYEEIMLGYNYRLTDIQAALGNSQLRRLDAYVEKRREIASWYEYEIKNSLIGSSFKTLVQKTHRKSSHHLFIIQSKIKSNNASIHQQMRDMGVGVNLHYIPVYQHPDFTAKIMLEGAESYYNGSMSLPIFPSISENEKQKVIDSLLSLSLQ